MRTLTYTSTFTLILLLSFTSCEGDSGIGQFDDIVIESSNNTNKFRQITFIISLYNPDYGYFNLESIDSLKVYVNAKYWGTFTSELGDTTDKTDRIVENIRYSDDEISYLFIALYQLRLDNLETAGDYVDYLNARIVLTPGDYVCEFKEVKYKDLQGSLITEKVQEFADFSVLENTTSSYVGRIIIPIE